MNANWKRSSSTICLICGRKGDHSIVLTSCHSIVPASGMQLSKFLFKIIGEEPCYSISEVLCQPCFLLLDRLDTYQARAAELNSHLSERYKETKLDYLGCQRRISDLLVKSLSNIKSLKNGTTLDVSDELSVTVFHQAMPRKQQQQGYLNRNQIVPHMTPSKEVILSKKRNSNLKRKLELSKDSATKKKICAKKTASVSKENCIPKNPKKRKVSEESLDLQENKSLPPTIPPRVPLNIESEDTNKDLINDSTKNQISLVEKQSELPLEAPPSPGITNNKDKNQVSHEPEDPSPPSESECESNDEEDNKSNASSDVSSSSDSSDSSSSSDSSTDSSSDDDTEEEGTKTPPSDRKDRETSEVCPNEDFKEKESVTNDEETSNLSSPGEDNSSLKEDTEITQSEETTPNKSADNVDPVDPSLAEAVLMQNSLASSLFQSFLSTSMWMNPSDSKSSPEKSDSQKGGVQCEDVTVDNIGHAVGAVKDKQKRLELKNTGQSYVNTKGKLVEAKRVLPQDCSRCPLKCNRRFGEEERLAIFAEYWGLGDYNLQREYLAMHMEREEKVGPSGLSRTVILYCLSWKNEKVQVCRQFFLKTLAVSEKASRLVLEKKVKGELGGETALTNVTQAVASLSAEDENQLSDAST